MADDFSNEGLFRLLEKMDREHGDDLKEIRKQTTETNSRVIKLETRADRNDRELKRLNSAVFPRSVVAAKDDAESLTVKVTPKIWAAIAAFGGVVFAMLVEWLKQRMATP